MLAKPKNKVMEKAQGESVSTAQRLQAKVIY